MARRGAVAVMLALAGGKALPSLHSPEQAPELEPSLRSTVKAHVVMLAELLNAPSSGS